MKGRVARFAERTTNSKLYPFNFQFLAVLMYFEFFTVFHLNRNPKIWKSRTIVKK